ncbi:hypothetical protein Tco_1166507 [Tanacetum coccineum]
MHEDFEYVESLEKEIDELESEKADFSNIYDLLLEECVSKDVTCSYLHSLSDLNAYAELQCLYLHKVKECECLAQKLSKQTESVNKEVHNKLLKSFAKLENHSISLELALQQCKEQMKNNSVCKENGSNVFRKEREQYHEIQDLKAQMQDKNIAISELKKLIEKCKGKSVETQFDKPSVVRQPNAQRIPKPSVLGKPTPFSNSPEMRSFQTKQSVNKTNVSDGLFKQVTQHNLPQNRKQAEIHTNTLTPGMYRIATSTTQNRETQLPHASRNTNPHVSTSTGVNHSTSVSRPQLKCYQVKDKKTKSVTAYNDISNSKPSNVNVVCYNVDNVVFNSNHDACVSKYLNDVNARTKKPKVVPISASKPKRKTNKSVTTPHKKTVASDTTIQKPKSYFKELYENTNKAWKWWIEKKCPPEYKWTQTTPSRPSLKWKPTGRISNVRLRWIPTGKLLNSYTGKVNSTSFNGQKQQRIDLNADALKLCKAENLQSPNSEFSSTAMNLKVQSLVPPKVVPRSSQDSYITTRVGITIPPSYSNAEDNSHKVVRLGINPMIQPELEDLPKDNPKLEIAVLRKTNVITVEKIRVLTRDFWCTIPTTWGKRCKKQFLMIKEENEGCSLQEKHENLTSEVAAASTSTMDGRRLEEIIKGLGIHSFFSASTLAASTSTMEDETYRNRKFGNTNRLRLEEMVNGLGLHSLHYKKK